MDEGRRDDDILWEGEPKRGWLTVWPNQVGIVMLDGNFEYTFTERKRKLPKGDVRTYVASTALFTLSFWLRDPSDPSPPSEGVALDLPVLTADGQLVTGRIDLTLTVNEENVDSLLPLSGQRGAVGKGEVAQAVKGDVQAALSSGLQGKTFGDLRGDPEVFQGIRGALKSACALAVRQYGLWLRDLNVTWGLTPEEREGVKEQRHWSAVRDIEREAEIGEARPQQPRRVARRRWAVGGIAAAAAAGVIVLAAVVFGGSFGGGDDARTAAGPPAPAAAAAPAASEPTMTPTVIPPTAAPEGDSRLRGNDVGGSGNGVGGSGNDGGGGTPTVTPEGDSRLRGNDVGGSGNDVGGSRNDVGGGTLTATPEGDSRLRGNDVGGSGNDVGGDTLTATPEGDSRLRGNDGGGGTPTLTAVPTAIPTATLTAVPTAIPTATNTAIPTATLTPTVTPVPTATPTPTNTPPPTAVPTSTPIRGEQAGALLRTITVGGRVLSSPAVLGGTMYVGSDDGNLYAVDIASQRELWRYRAGARIASTPAVSKGVVYVGSNDRHLHAIDAASGELRWKYETGAEVFSSPAVSNGVVYVGSDDNHLYAFDAVSGELRWQYETEDWVSTAPAVGGGAVYARSEDGILHAVNAATGEGLWQQHTTGADRVSASPAFADGVVYAGGNTLRALDASSGERLWVYGVVGQAFYSPVVADGIVYVVDFGHLYAIDASTGALLWLRWDNGLGGGIQPTSAAPLVAEGAVYVQSEDGHLYALDALTGTLLWRYETGGVSGGPRADGGVVYVAANGGTVYGMVASSPLATAAPAQEREAGDLLWQYRADEDLLSQPAAANGTLYVGAEDSYLYAIDALTGALAWRYKTDYRLVTEPPTTADGTVYSRRADGMLYAMDARSGELRWQYQAGESAWTSPTVNEGVVFTGSGDGSVHAIDASTGSLIWRYRTEAAVIYAPLVTNDRVYVVSSDDGYWRDFWVDLSIYALDAYTGNLLWRRDGVYSRPSVADGVLYVWRRHSGGGYPFYEVNVWDASTGNYIWAWNTAQITNHDIQFSPGRLRVVDGVAYIISTSGQLLALNVRTGDELWSYESGTSKSLLGVANGVVYTGDAQLNASTGELLAPSQFVVVAGYRFDTSTGVPLWESTSGRPTIADGVIYTASGRNISAFLAPTPTNTVPEPTPTPTSTPSPLQTGR